jgi:hypothetical protein
MVDGDDDSENVKMQRDDCANRERMNGQFRVMNDGNE